MISKYQYEFRLNAGAGFIVAVLGEIMTMPGLPKVPAAANMDMMKTGTSSGCLGETQCKS